MLLDKAAWTIRLRAGELRVVPAPGPRTEHRAALEAALVDTLAAFGPQDVDQTILGLSGGADSRGIGAILVRARPDLRWKSFTGGPAEAQGVPMTDATVSAEVAARLGTEHRFVLNRASPEPIVTVLDRFVQASEGRIDHLGGYLDGFAGLNALSADGIGVIIRGDTSFGGPLWEPLDSEFAMRQTINLLLCREISNLAPHVERFGLAGQRLPDLLPRHDCESLLSWRDRLYLQFRTATVLQALTETKSAFVDIVNPLMSRRALAVSCALPDDLRLDKALFREVVRDLVPDLPFARDHGGVTVPEVLNRPEVRRMLAASLASDTAREVFGAPFVDWVRREIDPLHRARVKALRKLTSWLGGRRPAPGSPALPIVHPLRLAFRVHMARMMIDQLRADAARFVDAPRAGAGPEDRPPSPQRRRLRIAALTSAASSGVTPGPCSLRVSAAAAQRRREASTPGRIARGRRGRPPAVAGAAAPARTARSASGVCGSARAIAAAIAAPLPGAHQLDQAEPEPLGQLRREAQAAVERVVDLEEGADARALGPRWRWRRARAAPPSRWGRRRARWRAPRPGRARTG